MDRIPPVRWLARLGVATLGGVLAAGVLAVPAHAATPCEADCISTLSVTPYADGASVAVTTASPAMVSVDVVFGGAVVASMAEDPSADYATSHALTKATGLKQRTWYTFVVKATDNYGHTWKESVTRRTPHRSATITVTNVAVTNDSDDGGPGEFAQGLSVAGQTTFVGGLYDEINTRSVSSMGSFTSGMAISLPTAISPVTTKYELADNDRDTLVGDTGLDSTTCTRYLGTPWGVDPKYSNFGAGSDTCVDWNTASMAIPMSNTIGVDTQTWNVVAPSGKAVGFTATFVVSTEVVNVPEAPAAPSAKAGNGAALVSWAAPASNGRAISGYTVTSSTGKTCSTVGTSCVVSGLTNGVPVTFRVVAKNAEGDSAVSAASAATTPIAVPLPPVVTSSSAGNGSVTVTVAPPAAPGGSPVTTYRITALQSGTSSTSTSPTLTLGGLSNGTTYSVVVHAYNAQGWSLPSAVVALRPGLASTITGWSTTPVLQKAGTKVTLYLTVGPDGEGRTGRLQFRRQGTTSWTTHLVQTSPVSGYLLMDLPVKNGIYEWRLALDAKGVYAGAVSPIRTVSALTTVAGFATTTVTAALGSVVTDAVVVAPGFLRTVWVQYRKAGYSTWTTFAKLACDAGGNVTVTEKVLAGKYSWRVYVPASTLHGTAVSTALRTINAL